MLDKAAMADSFSSIDREDSCRLFESDYSKSSSRSPVSLNAFLTSCAPEATRTSRPVFGELEGADTDIDVYSSYGSQINAFLEGPSRTENLNLHHSHEKSQTNDVVNKEPKSVDLTALLSGRSVTKQKKEGSSKSGNVNGQVKKKSASFRKMDTEKEGITESSYKLSETYYKHNDFIDVERYCELNSVSDDQLNRAKESDSHLRQLSSNLTIAEDGRCDFGTTANQRALALENDIEILESKIYGEDIKRISAKDFFQSLNRRSPSKECHEDLDQSYFVTLHIRPSKLAEVKRCENPLFTKGNSSMSSSLFRPEHPLKQFLSSSISPYHVTLKLPPSKLTPFAVQWSKLKKVKSSCRLFNSMMSSSSRHTRATPLQKLKELQPIPLKRYQFHVYPKDSWLYSSIMESKILKPKHLQEMSSVIDQDSISSLRNSSGFQKRQFDTHILYYDDPTWINDYASEKVNSIDFFLKVLDRLKQRTLSRSKKLLWTDVYLPNNIDDVLIAIDKKVKLTDWFSTSFAKLKSPSLRKPRHISLRGLKKQRKKDSLKFGVELDTSSPEYSIIEEDIFVPLLILKGRTGSCKSTCVYSAMADMKGYVHEINTSHQRSKKDIISSLKELSTTQLVHMHEEEKDFQKGIILLEDCDILFEQDKNFWSAVYEILDITRRPLVLTCRDTCHIPQNILDLAKDEDSIIDLDESFIDHEQVYDYIWICCILQGFEIDKPVLLKILDDCSVNGDKYDIRKALMECQFLCQACACPLKGNFIEKISFAERKQPALFNANKSLIYSMAEDCEMLSSADIISHSSLSLLEHDKIENEFLEIKYIDESMHMKQKNLPFETNIGHFLERTILNDDSKCENVKLSVQDIREVTRSFVNSRSKPLPKNIDTFFSTRLLRSSTVNNSEMSDKMKTWESDPLGLHEFSITVALSTTPYILELAPFGRKWYHFQKALDDVEGKTLEQLGVSVKNFIKWRPFRDNSKRISFTFI